ncbi:MAG TPA: tetratricopeptide repeat protein [Steroidobacter sp.]|uniref:tetratricopeptide repeat protein n=1 Tax=Steroidobacter sp. TaxID=1978227 RepID=UPI002EDB4EA3
MPGRCNKLLAAVALALGAACAGAKERPPEPRSLVGTPQVVRDLHWGDVLFYFYQGDYMQALTRLGASQDFNRITHHGVEAELLKGGLYLSLGQHEEAGRIFKALLNDNVPLDVRNRAWFYLAKVWYQRNYLEDSATALSSIRGALPGDLEPERHLLEAQVLMYLNRYDEAIRALERWQPVGDHTDVWSSYARFNIGVALVRQERVEEAAELLNDVGQIAVPTEELAALRDKANLALGFAWLKANRPEDAKKVLQRVRLEGPQSNKALLAVGWADSAEKRFNRALAPWMELRDRDILDAAVQESYLAVPYAYAQLAATGQAAQQYVTAVEAFAKESQRIDQSIQAIRDGKLLDAIIENDEADQVGWYWQLQNLPDAPETRYLYHLLATHEFQEGLKNYRDLRLMQRNLATWSLSVQAFEDMVDARRRAFEQRQPGLRKTLDTVDFDGLEAQKNDLELKLTAAERDNDVAALATAREQEQWAKVQRIEAVLARADQNDPMVQEMREKARLIRGKLLWDFNASYKARLWRARKEQRELDVAYKEARRRSVLVERAREDYPARTDQFARRVATLPPRIDGLSARLEATAQAQNRYLAAVAIKELETQKQRLAAYSVQARFALASIYDKAATSGRSNDGADSGSSEIGSEKGGAQ